MEIPVKIKIRTLPKDDTNRQLEQINIISPKYTHDSLCNLIGLSRVLTQITYGENVDGIKEASCVCAFYSSAFHCAPLLRGSLLK